MVGKLAHNRNSRCLQTNPLFFPILFSWEEIFLSTQFPKVKDCPELEDTHKDRQSPTPDLALTYFLNFKMHFRIKKIIHKNVSNPCWGILKSLLWGFFHAIFNFFTLNFVCHCFYWLWLSKEPVWHFWYKLKLWPHSVKGCNFVLGLTLYHKVFARLQEERFSFLSCMATCMQISSAVSQN